MRTFSHTGAMPWSETHDERVVVEPEPARQLADCSIAGAKRLRDRVLSDRGPCGRKGLLSQVDEQELVLDLVHDRLVEHEEVESLARDRSAGGGVEVLREPGHLGEHLCQG